MKEEQTDTEPRDIITMIKEYWSKLYRSNKDLESQKGKERKWYMNEEWKKYVK